MMLRHRTILFAAALLVVSASVRADDASATLVQADRAFAAADYKTAVALYEKLDARLTDAAQKASLQERMQYARRQLDQQPAASATPSAVPATPVSGAAAATPGAPAVANVSGDPSTQPSASAAATRVPHPAPVEGRTTELTLHELGNFDFNPDDEHLDPKTAIPADVWRLSGSKVKISGCMLALDQAGRVTRFMLVNDMMSCCFGTSPKIQHVALVTLPKDKWIANTPDRITIEGVLKVNVRKDDDFISSIFEIEPTSVKLATP